MRDQLGGKGANLAEMARLGVPVPPGFTIGTSVARELPAGSDRIPAALAGDVRWAIARVEAIMGPRFGDREDPLLFSVRSGAPVSMPGMMDTVLNLGLDYVSCSPFRVPVARLAAAQAALRARAPAPRRRGR